MNEFYEDFDYPDKECNHILGFRVYEDNDNNAELLFQEDFDYGTYIEAELEELETLDSCAGYVKSLRFKYCPECGERL